MVTSFSVFDSSLKENASVHFRTEAEICNYRLDTALHGGPDVATVAAILGTCPNMHIGLIVTAWHTLAVYMVNADIVIVPQQIHKDTICITFGKDLVL